MTDRLYRGWLNPTTNGYLSRSFRNFGRLSPTTSRIIVVRVNNPLNFLKLWRLDSLALYIWLIEKNQYNFTELRFWPHQLAYLAEVGQFDPSTRKLGSGLCSPNALLLNSDNNLNGYHGNKVFFLYSGCTLIVPAPYRSICPLSFHIFWKESPKFSLFGSPIAPYRSNILPNFSKESCNDKRTPTV